MAYDPNRLVKSGIWDEEKQRKRVERRRKRKLGLLPPTALKNATQDPVLRKKAQEASSRVISVEFARPEQAAAALVFEGAPEGFDPIRFEEYCRQAGLPKPVTDGVLKRLKLRFAPIVNEVKVWSTKHFQDMLDDRIGKALGYLDDSVLSSASAKDLAITIGILIEKRALLRGEPTQILTVEERQNLNVLVSAVVQEATRRGITIDQTGDEVRAVGGRGKNTMNLPMEIQST